MNRRGFLGSLLGGVIAAPVIAEVAAKVLEEPRVKITPKVPAIPLNFDGMEVGDIFTISGFYATNPATRKSTGILKQFVFTGNQTFFPAPLDNGQFQNVWIDWYVEHQVQKWKYHDGETGITVRYVKNIDYPEMSRMDILYGMPIKYDKTTCFIQG